MARRIWIISEGTEIDRQVRDDAETNNCPEIVNGIPPALQGVISESNLPVAYEEPEPAEPRPPLSTHWAIIDSINLGSEKPVRVKRTWEGVEYTVNCYATENIKDQYLAGDIAVGDYVMVEFLDDDPDRAVVFAKVFKTW